jgi:hypothetical protein
MIPTHPIRTVDGQSPDQKGPTTMARIILSDDEIHIELSLWEKVFGLMGNRTIPRSDVTEVALENDPLGATRGLRAPGLGVPGSVKVGTWRRNGRKVFVSIRRSTPAVRIEATGLDRDAFLVSVSDADGVVTALSS